MVIQLLISSSLRLSGVVQNVATDTSISNWGSGGRRIVNWWTVDLHQAPVAANNLGFQDARDDIQERQFLLSISYKRGS
jgi:hypothetical protein